MSTVSECQRNFSTGLRSEVTKLHWKIEDFQAMLELEEPLKSARLKFDAGHTIGLPTKWIFYLENKLLKEGKLGFYMQLLDLPKDCQGIYAAYTAVVKDVNGADYVRKGIKAREHQTAEKGWGFTDFFGQLPHLSAEVLRNGDLHMDITFKLINFDKTSGSAINTEASFNNKQLQENSKSVLSYDLQKLFEERTNSDFKIIVKDGKEFPVHRNILGCRSPVFLAMFESKMEEASSGIVHVEDMTSDAMEIVLKFIYSGIVDDNWKDSAEEVIYAAEKYSLTLLKEFCDRMLVEAVNPENAIELLKIARKFKLKMAEKELTEFANRNFKDILNAAISI